MKMTEFIEKVRQSEKDTCNWYASRIVGLEALRDDILEAVEEGYLEGISADRPIQDRMRVRCEDGVVFVTKSDKLQFETVADRPRRSSYVRPASHYERTRAMVHATGNKWAIENFEATHC